MLVPPKLRTAVVILEKSAPPPGAVSSWKFGWNSGLPPGTSTSSFLNFLAVSTSPYSRSEPPLAVIRYVSPSISKASMALGERSVLNSGTCFSWHALSRTVSSPRVPPLAPQSCGPSEHVEAEAPRVRREDGRWGEMGRDCARWGRNDAAVLQAERGEALGGGGRHIHRQDGRVDLQRGEELGAVGSPRQRLGLEHGGGRVLAPRLGKVDHVHLLV
mmetsp:Transcript_2666/g.8703  ORF Transcript_2666/g.8703 Transcript_2666/m.8703 type:complete len:216 (-) Transcript_2666:742-1389(-)